MYGHEQSGGHAPCSRARVVFGGGPLNASSRRRRLATWRWRGRCGSGHRGAERRAEPSEQGDEKESESSSSESSRSPRRGGRRRRRRRRGQGGEVQGRGEQEVPRPREPGQGPHATQRAAAAGGGGGDSGRGGRRRSSAVKEAPAKLTVVTEVKEFVAIPIVKFHLRKEAATQALYQVVISLYMLDAFSGEIADIMLALASDIVFAASTSARAEPSPSPPLRRAGPRRPVPRPGAVARAFGVADGRGPSARARP